MKPFITYANMRLCDLSGNEDFSPWYDGVKH